MDEHLIFFIDVLGFRQAVDDLPAGPPERVDAILKLLRDLAEQRSERAISSQTLISPAVTTFSDHIVLSHPTKDICGPRSPFLNLGMALTRSFIGEFALAAVELGLLIRGGIAVGPLFHEGNIVFGRAMNEAYELESAVAVYPRIVVSRDAYSRTSDDGKRELLLEGDDGIPHLDYFTQMLFLGADWEDGGANPRLRDTFARLLNFTEKNIGQLKQSGRWNEWAKWVWFKKQLADAGARLPRAFFEN